MKECDEIRYRLKESEVLWVVSSNIIVYEACDIDERLVSNYFDRSNITNLRGNK